MKALVLGGTRVGAPLPPVAGQGMTAAFTERVDDVELVKLRELDIASCAGCFGCWTRTPGECVVRDSAHDVPRSYVGSDIVVYATPVTFGGDSCHLKNMLDRFIPVLDPRFPVGGGGGHH